MGDPLVFMLSVSIDSSPLVKLQALNIKGSDDDYKSNHSLTEAPGFLWKEAYQENKINERELEELHGYFENPLE